MAEYQWFYRYKSIELTNPIRVRPIKKIFLIQASNLITFTSYFKINILL